MNILPCEVNWGTTCPCTLSVSLSHDSTRRYAKVLPPLKRKLHHKTGGLVALKRLSFDSCQNSIMAVFSTATSRNQKTCDRFGSQSRLSRCPQTTSKERCKRYGTH